MSGILANGIGLELWRIAKELRASEAGGVLVLVASVLVVREQGWLVAGRIGRGIRTAWQWMRGSCSGEPERSGGMRRFWEWLKGLTRNKAALALQQAEEDSRKTLSLLMNAADEIEDLQAAVRQREEDAACQHRAAQETALAHHKAVAERERWSQRWSDAEARLKSSGLANAELQIAAGDRTRERDAALAQLAAAEQKSAAFQREALSLKTENHALRQGLGAAERRETDAAVLISEAAALAALVAAWGRDKDTADAHEGA